jgi:thiamine biosynthesis lipoprotein
MERKIRHAFSAMGTECEIQLVVPEKAVFEIGKHLQKIEEIYFSAVKTFSRFDQGSELSVLNKKLGVFSHASKQLIVVADLCLRYYEKTEGIFDPRIIEALEQAGYDKDFRKVGFGENQDTKEISIENFESKSLREDLIIENQQIKFGKRMDFSGIVKGFITDEASRYLQSVGIENFLVDSGGDIFAAGHDINEECWYIGIEGVAEEKMMLKLKNESVATSGISRRKWEKNGKRMHHIVNPKQPENFSFDLKSVTVSASSTEQADVWAKTLFLMGEEQGKKFAQENAIKCIFIDYRSAVWISEELKKNLH